MNFDMSRYVLSGSTMRFIGDDGPVDVASVDGLTFDQLIDVVNQHRAVVDPYQPRLPPGEHAVVSLDSVFDQIEFAGGVVDAGGMVLGALQFLFTSSAVPDQQAEQTLVMPLDSLRDLRRVTVTAIGRVIDKVTREQQRRRG